MEHEVKTLIDDIFFRDDANPTDNKVLNYFDSGGRIQADLVCYVYIIIWVTSLIYVPTTNQAAWMRRRRRSWTCSRSSPS